MRARAGRAGGAARGDKRAALAQRATARAQPGAGDRPSEAAETVCEVPGPLMVR